MWTWTGYGVVRILMLDFVVLDFCMSIEFVLNFSLGFSCMRFLAVSDPLVLVTFNPNFPFSTASPCVGERCYGDTRLTVIHEI